MDTYNVNNLESFHFNIGVLHAREHASHTNLLSWCKVNKAANGNVWLKLVSPKWIMLKPSLCKIICTLKLNLLFTLALYFLFRCLISPKNSIDCYKFLSSQSIIFCELGLHWKRPIFFPSFFSPLIVAKIHFSGDH